MTDIVHFAHDIGYSSLDWELFILLIHLHDRDQGTIFFHASYWIPSRLAKNFLVQPSTRWHLPGLGLLLPLTFQRDLSYLLLLFYYYHYLAILSLSAFLPCLVRSLPFLASLLFYSLLPVLTAITPTGGIILRHWLPTY